VKAVLMLEDGSIYVGEGFGRTGIVVGEVVFTTGMVGYLHSLTDPSYKGQILVFTYPLIGNYGVPSYSKVDEYGLPKYFESTSIKVEGAVVYEACKQPSHWASSKTLHEWFYEEGKPGISGVDTRAIVRKLREKGTMMGVLGVFEDEVDFEALTKALENSTKYGEINFVEQVSPRKPITHTPPNKRARVVLIDCGVKLGILRNLLKMGLEVIRVPYNYPLDKILEHEPKGIIVGNGPGNPELLTRTIEIVKALIEYDYPILGICLGHQLISLALGAKTFKLPYGHRGINKSCIDITTGKAYITSQNHGYAVNPETLKNTGLKTWFINADDKTIEGILHEKKPVIGVQFHPEARPGPHDTLWIFKKYIKYLA